VKNEDIVIIFADKLKHTTCGLQVRVGYELI